MLKEIVSMAPVTLLSFLTLLGITVFFFACVAYNKIKKVLFQAMIFETAFQNLVVLIYVVKTDLFCFMRSAFLLYITLYHVIII